MFTSLVLVRDNRNKQSNVGEWKVKSAKQNKMSEIKTFSIYEKIWLSMSMLSFESNVQCSTRRIRTEWGTNFLPCEIFTQKMKLVIACWIANNVCDQLRYETITIIMLIQFRNFFCAHTIHFGTYFWGSLEWFFRVKFFCFPEMRRKDKTL